MTYNAFETSSANGKPVELYRFTYYDSVFTYCSGDDEFSYNGDIYAPYPTQREGLEMSEDMQRTVLEVHVPRDSEVVELFNYGPPEGVIGVTVFRYHRDDSDLDYISIFKGRVGSCSIQGDEATLSCEPIFSSLKRVGLRLMYDVICPHGLYDPKCKVLKEDFQIPASVLTINGLDIGVQQAANYPDGWFSFGVLAVGDVRRMITNHVGSIVTVMHPLPSSLVGEDCVLLPGCDHLRSTCNDKFNNILNYGGFSWIPIKNPFTGDNVFWG